MSEKTLEELYIELGSLCIKAKKSEREYKKLINQKIQEIKLREGDENGR